MQPNFLIIGGMKCGTTSLCAYLNQHPDVFVPSPKDLYFFSNDENYSKGWDWYLRKFEGADGCSAIGEGTDNYSKSFEFPKAPERIKKHLPGAKIIYITRNPIKQVQSAWAHMRMSEGEQLPFDKAIFSRGFYVDNCRYLKQLNIYRNLFSQENILVLFLEDLVADLNNELKKVFQFICVDQDFIIRDEKPQNVRLEKHGDRAFLKKIKAISFVNEAYSKMPDSIKNIVRPVVKFKMKDTPSLSDTDKNKFINMVKDETVEFLSINGKPKSFWDTEDCPWSELVR